MSAASLTCLVVVALSVTQCHSAKLASSDNILKTESMEYYFDDDKAQTRMSESNLTISEIIEKANKNAGDDLKGTVIKYGDVLVPTDLQNANPCTASTCKWPASEDGIVYVPYIISTQYLDSEVDTIKSALRAIEEVTCIRFPQRTTEQSYINILSETGCYSSVGMQSGEQQLSLQRTACLYSKIIQHEVMHVLGFDHEQSRSDRDLHIRILEENIEPGMEDNFDKIDTFNLGTPYDYNSIMQYAKDAFSKNREPTMIPFPDPTVPIGEATQMSFNDIARVNILYQCNVSYNKAL